jgi:hypothetical protein
VLISYEVFFAERARAATRAGGRVLLVPTIASSYTTGQVPAQEVAAARLRAIETGRAVVQAVPTGYSALLDRTGEWWHEVGWAARPSFGAQSSCARARPGAAGSGMGRSWRSPCSPSRSPGSARSGTGPICQEPGRTRGHRGRAPD